MYFRMTQEERSIATTTQSTIKIELGESSRI